MGIKPTIKAESITVMIVRKSTISFITRPTSYVRVSISSSLARLTFSASLALVTFDGIPDATRLSVLCTTIPTKKIVPSCHAI